MAKWYGKIGYVETVESKPGVWIEQKAEREYFGDLLQNSRRLESGDQVVNDFNINNKISIVADPYAMNHFHSMRYAEFMGAYWKITNVEVLYPRLILTLGGVYNGKQARTAN